MDYLFKTSATVKENDQGKYWIDGDFIGNVEIWAENLPTALVKYADIIKDRYYVEISKTAIQRKRKMYIDRKSGETVQTGYVVNGQYEFEHGDRKSGETVQIGYVINGKCDFEVADGRNWVKKNVDLWVEIKEISIPDFGKLS